MTFTTIKSSDISSIFSMGEVSELILYNSVPIRSIVDRVPEDNKGEGFDIPSIYFQVLKSDVSAVVRSDTVVYGGLTYSRPIVAEESDLTWLVEMVQGDGP